MVEFNLRWFGHVWRRPIDFAVKIVDQMKSIPIARGRGKPRRVIGETIKKDLEVNSLDKYMISDRTL